MPSTICLESKFGLYPDVGKWNLTIHISFIYKSIKGIWLSDVVGNHNMHGSPVVKNKTKTNTPQMYKIAKFGSQRGLRSEGVLQSHDKELLRKMAWSCCACNYTMTGESTYGQIPLQKSNTQVYLNIAQKCYEVLFKSNFVPAHGMIF